MHTRQLETFVNLAKTLNYAATARALYISQPAVTQQIARLEQELGVKLFERDTRKVELTAAGRAFCEDCKDILSRLDNAMARARGYARRFSDSIRIGCSSDAAVRQLDRLLSLYLKVMPDVHPYVLHDDPVSTLGKLTHRELDVAFGARSRHLNPPGITFRELFRGRFVCVMPTGSPLAACDAIALSDVAGQSLIFLEEDSCPPEMREVQDQIALMAPESIVYYSGSALVSATMIKAGIGMAVMPNFACPDLPDICVRPMEGLGEIPYGAFWIERDEDERVRSLIDCAAKVYSDEPGEHGSRTPTQ